MSRPVAACGTGWVLGWFGGWELTDCVAGSSGPFVVCVCAGGGGDFSYDDDDRDFWLGFIRWFSSCRQKLLLMSYTLVLGGRRMRKGVVRRHLPSRSETCTITCTMACTRPPAPCTCRGRQIERGVSARAALGTLSVAGSAGLPWTALHEACWHCQHAEARAGEQQVSWLGQRPTASGPTRRRRPTRW